VGAQLTEVRLGNNPRIEPGWRGTKFRIGVGALLNFQRSESIAADAASNAATEAADAAQEVDRLPSIEAGNSTDRPATQGVFDDAIRSVLEEGSVINIVHHEDVRPIEGGSTAKPF